MLYLHKKKLLPRLRLVMTGGRARYLYVVTVVPKKLLPRLRLVMTGAEPGTCMLLLLYPKSCYLPTVG